MVSGFWAPGTKGSALESEVFLTCADTDFTHYVPTHLLTLSLSLCLFQLPKREIELDECTPGHSASGSRFCRRVWYRRW